MSGREFWIEVKSFSSEVLSAYDEKPDEATFRIAKAVYHVIDMSAYEALEKELAEAYARCNKFNEQVNEQARELERLKAENDLIKDNFKRHGEASDGVIKRLTEALEYAKGQLQHAGYTKNAVPMIDKALSKENGG